MDSARDGRAGRSFLAKALLRFRSTATHNLTLHSIHTATTTAISIRNFAKACINDHVISKSTMKQRAGSRLQYYSRLNTLPTQMFPPDLILFTYPITLSLHRRPPTSHGSLPTRCHHSLLRAGFCVSPLLLLSKYIRTPFLLRRLSIDPWTPIPLSHHMYDIGLDWSRSRRAKSSLPSPGGL